MTRSTMLFPLLAAMLACEAPPASPPATTVAELEPALRPLGASVTREPMGGDLWHDTFTLTVGDGPNARLVVHRITSERSSSRSHRSAPAVMMMHGDFASFATNFAPGLGTPASTATGLGPWLAARGVDVWGFDRRWTQAPADGADLSDFDAMGLAQELEDVGVALGLARAVRLVTDHSLDRITLVGFSRGGQLAYAFASVDAARPSWQRQVKGLVPLDVYAALSPADEVERQFFCDSAYYEYLDLEAGVVDSPNRFVIRVGSLARSDPDGQTPFQGIWPGYTNRDVLRSFAGQTYSFFWPSPLYHLAGPELDGDFPVGLRWSAEDEVAAWFAGASPHQALREAADTDALLCGVPPFAVDAPLSRIRVPLFLIAAAGGYGERAIYTTTQVSSSDVSTLVVRRLPAAQEAEDFGHGDLLFGTDAPALAWEPLRAWLEAHR